MNINDLSDLAYVLEQVKTVLNTGSNTRYPKEKIHELKRRVTALEGRFVDEVLDLDLDSLGEDTTTDLATLVSSTRVKPAVITAPAPQPPTRKFGTTNKAVKNESGAVVVEAPEEPVAEVSPEHAAVTAHLKGLTSKLAVSKEEVEAMAAEELAVVAAKGAKKTAKDLLAADEDMDEFRRKLAAEKKKLATKKKKAETE